MILNHAKKYFNKGIWIYIRVYTPFLNIALFCMMSLLYQIANFIDIDMYRYVFYGQNSKYEYRVGDTLDLAMVPSL